MLSVFRCHATRQGRGPGGQPSNGKSPMQGVGTTPGVKRKVVGPQRIEGHCTLTAVRSYLRNNHFVVRTKRGRADWEGPGTRADRVKRAWAEKGILSRCREHAGYEVQLVRAFFSIFSEVSPIYFTEHEEGACMLSSFTNLHIL